MSTQKNPIGKNSIQVRRFQEEHAELSIIKMGNLAEHQTTLDFPFYVIKCNIKSNASLRQVNRMDLLENCSGGGIKSNKKFKC